MGCWLIFVQVTFTKLMGGQTSHLILYRDMLLWLLSMSHEPQKIPARTSHIYLAGLSQDLGHVSSQHSSRDSSSPQQFYWQLCVTAAVSAILSPPCRNMGVANTHHAEKTISVCHYGPSVNSWTRQERPYLPSCLPHPEDVPEALVRPHLSTGEAAP